jgi:hypothetical protein
VIKLSAKDAPAELRAVILALHAAPKEMRKVINADTRATINPVWQSEVSQHLTGAGRLEGQLLTPGTRVNAGNPPVLVAASSKKKVGRGVLTPDANWPIYEFGAKGDKLSKMKSKKGKTYGRHTRRGLPQYKASGHVLYPALASVLPRVAALWSQSVIRIYMQALGEKGS